MNKMNALSLNVLFVFVLTINMGESLNCWICSSLRHEGCNKRSVDQLPSMDCKTDGLKFTNSLAREIDSRLKTVFDEEPQEPALRFHCFKQVITVQTEAYVLRGCHMVDRAGKDVCEKLKDMGNFSLKLRHCNSCDSDGCNASSRINVSLLLLFSAIMNLIKCIY